MKLLNRVLLFVSGFFFCMNLVHANVAIKQETIASIVDNTVVLELNISNTGDTPVFNVRPRLHFLDENNVLSKLADLPVGLSYQQTFRRGLKGGFAGEMHILSIVTYDDEQKQQHINAAVLYLKTMLISDRPVNYFLNVEDSTSFEISALLVLKSKVQESIEVDLKLITPESVGINQQSKKLKIGGGGEYVLPIILNSFNFKTITSNPLYAIASYQYDGVNYSHLEFLTGESESDLSVLRYFFTSRPLLIGLVAILFVVLLVTSAANWRKRND